MQALLSLGNAFNSVMGIFGSTIIVPIVIFIISMCMRVGVKKSFQGAIYMAVGLTLFNAVLGILMSAITPYVTAMASNVGISLPYIGHRMAGGIRCSIFQYLRIYLSGIGTWLQTCCYLL
ncbi:MAG: PTS transporter subunit IIC [Coprococcus sp.]